VNDTLTSEGAVTGSGVIEADGLATADDGPVISFPYSLEGISSILSRMKRTFWCFVGRMW
jgi:hypothetical protein